MQLYIVGGVAPTPYILIKMTQLILDVLKEIEQVPTSACTLHLMLTYYTSYASLFIFWLLPPHTLPQEYRETSGYNIMMIDLAALEKSDSSEHYDLREMLSNSLVQGKPLLLLCY